jgi:hypothetical protein
VISESRAAPWHRLKVTWITAVILIPALAIPMPLLAQAYGNLFVPALLLVFGLGVMLYSAGRRDDAISAGAVSANLGLREYHVISNSR